MYVHLPSPKFAFITASLRLCDYTTKKVTSFQERLLEKIFDDNPNPSLPLRYELASAMGVKRRKVDKWFYHQRKKRKRSTDCITPT